MNIVQSSSIVVVNSLKVINAGMDQMTDTTAIMTQTFIPSVAVKTPKPAKAQNRPMDGMPIADLQPFHAGYLIF